MTMPTSEKSQRTVVIGAGQAGFEFCAKLRALGDHGPITLIGEEDHPPYQRPPLSKAYLLGKMQLERLFLRPRSFFEEQGITLKLGTRCREIDRASKTVTISDGTVLPYDRLVFATGARPVQLPDKMGGALKQVHYVRTLADADAMVMDFQAGKHVFIVGGGYIGLEAAAVALDLGMNVTLVEAGPRILGRVAATETSDFFRELHVNRGVKIFEGVQLTKLIGENGNLTGAELSDGRQIDIDVAVVGIGVTPNQDLADAAGLEIENGIKVDAFCRTSDPDIYALGDCASFPMGKARIRMESVGNAIDQAQAAASVFAGTMRPYRAKPWFWSDQYDVKLQIIGLSTGYDRVVTRGGPSAPVSFWYFAETRLIAVDAINDPRAYMVAKRLIEHGKMVDPDRVADIETDLKSLLKQDN